MGADVDVGADIHSACAGRGTGRGHAAKASIGSRTAENWVIVIAALVPLTIENYPFAPPRAGRGPV